LRLAKLVVILPNMSTVAETKLTTVAEIEAAVVKLSDDELAAFRDWFNEFDADAWDRQFEKDALSGRLDALGEEALRDLREGRCTDL
jgi:hypothetical protein